MDKVAIIVQRYGAEVNGGAELHARLLAERLNNKYDVEVITTCAKDYKDWENYYPEGEDSLNGLKVIRFKVQKKNWTAHRRLSRYLFGNWKYSNKRYSLSNFIKLCVRKYRYRRRKNHNLVFESWMDEQGPCCPNMLSFLADKKEHYKAFIFFTYLYYPTYRGLPLVSEKSIFIPTAHDEPYFHYDGFHKLFAAPRFIMYNTLMEKQLVESAYPETKSLHSNIAGVGFDVVSFSNHLRPKIAERYFVYIGRIDAQKGCKELISYFLKFRKKNQGNVCLVMIGQNYMNDIEIADGIYYTGFISEEEKLAYLKHSEGLIIPSHFESLSMVTLEAMSQGKPVLANGKCEVLKFHIDQSKAGYTYRNQNEFNTSMRGLLTLTEESKSLIAKNGIAYVNKNYTWNRIVDKFIDAIDYVDSF